MAKFAYPDLKIELDNATPALQDISAYVTAINGWTKERIVEEITGAGDANDRHADIGFLQKNEVELTGPYDNTADGLLDIVKNWTDGSERTLQLTFDGATAADVETVECLLVRVQRNPTRGGFTQVVVTLRPTGAIT